MGMDRRDLWELNDHVILGLLEVLHRAHETEFIMTLKWPHLFPLALVWSLVPLALKPFVKATPGFLLKILSRVFLPQVLDIKASVPLHQPHRAVTTMDHHAAPIQVQTLEILPDVR